MVDPYNNQKNDDNVIEFRPCKKNQVEHVDSTTIVERIEMTDELRQLFITQGYDLNED